MLYSIVAEDREESLQNRMRSRPDHVERLKQLQQQGRLVLAGPNPAIDSIDPGSAGFTGSIIIAEFENLDDATQWANDDPYMKADVYTRVVVKPFNKVLPA